MRCEASHSPPVRLKNKINLFILDRVKGAILHSLYPKRPDFWGETVSSRTTLFTMSDKVSVEQTKASKVNQTCHLPSSNLKSKKRPISPFISIGLYLLICIIGCITEYSPFYQCSLRELKELGVITSESDINKEDNDGNTLLHKAAKEGNTEVVELLIEARADVRHTNKAGATPLGLAAGRGHTEVVKLLIEAGAR